MSAMYFDPEKIEILCREIDMPEEVTAEIKRRAEGISCGGALFDGLFSLETGGASAKAIKERFKGDESGFDELTVYTAAALRTWEIYLEKGIPRDIYTDTVKAFSRFTREHMESRGCYGFDRGFWMYRCLSASLFRLGALEFEMCVHKDGIGKYAGPGDPVLSVHIPSDAVMTREALDSSYNAADAFFRRHFPGFAYKCVYCDTWLLSPALAGMLPETSKILLFGSDYEIVSRNESDREYVQWVFKKQCGDVNLLPENTSLQRNVKKYMLSGGNIGSALGILKKRTR